MSLTKEQIEGADDSSLEVVQVPEWGGEIYIRVMTGGDRDSFEQEIADGGERPNIRNLRAKLAQRTVCDEKGDLLFAPPDIPVLAKKSALVLDRIFQAAQRINKIGDNEIGELEKN